MSTLPLSRINTFIRQAIPFAIVLFACASNADAVTGPAARTLAQPLLSAFQHSVMSSGTLGMQSKNSLECVAALPQDSFADLIQEALSQGLSSTDLTITDAYFSRPAFSTEIPYLIAHLQGVKLSATKLTRPTLSQADQQLEAELLQRNILHKLMSAYYFKSPQVFSAFNIKSKNLLAQCAIRQNDQRDPLRVLA